MKLYVETLAEIARQGQAVPLLLTPIPDYWAVGNEVTIEHVTFAARRSPSGKSAAKSKVATWTTATKEPSRKNKGQSHSRR